MQMDICRQLANATAVFRTAISDDDSSELLCGFFVQRGWKNSALFFYVLFIVFAFRVGILGFQLYDSTEPRRSQSETRRAGCHMAENKAKSK